MLKKKKTKKMSAKKKILFICTHNSARSQMAEGLTKSIYGDNYDVSSAGTQPSEINPYTIQVMKEVGIDISQQRSKSINEFRGQKFDYVITVCDRAKETCPFFPGVIIIHRGFKDPSQAKGTEDEILTEFRKIRDEIKVWIRETFKDKAWKGPVKQNIGKINKSHFIQNI